MNLSTTKKSISQKMTGSKVAQIMNQKVTSGRLYQFLGDKIMVQRALPETVNSPNLSDS